MRVNVYTEELLRSAPEVSPPSAEIVFAEYVSSRTGEKMRNYGLRVYLDSSPHLHMVLNEDGSVRDDDRSAVTFWCGPGPASPLSFLQHLTRCAEHSNMLIHRAKVQEAAAEAEEVLSIREMFASELERDGLETLAAHIRDGTDNSLAGRPALRTIAKAVATIVKKTKNQPLLGLATTGELIEEVKTRISVHAEGGLEYRTVDKS